MKILVVTHDTPYPLTHGAWLCVYHIFKKLAKKHEIFLLSFEDGIERTDGLTRLRQIFKNIYLIKSDKKRPSLRRYLYKVLSLNSGLIKREEHPEVYQRFKEKIMELVISENIDILHCTTLNMAEFGSDVKGCLKVLHIIDSSTLEMKRRISLQGKLGWYKKIYNLIWYRRIKNYERKMISNFDLNITVGEKDGLVLKSLSPEANIAVIPNGVDVEICGIPSIAFFRKHEFFP
jgi:glycosyltransferase involved in cell wall biosynthesis